MTTDPKAAAVDITQTYTNMSKAIKWQIPFASLSGTLYRLDIYAEADGTWDTTRPIQLTAGETPFVTEEDSSEDYFCPVRTQTGTIQICTVLPDGSTFDVNELLPENNLSYPVQLISLENNQIEWLGFLSCEVYSQEYTAIPKNFSIPVIGVLEAMKSVKLDQSVMHGLEKIYNITNSLFQETESQGGISLFTHINISQRSYNIFRKYIDQNIFFKEETVNDDANNKTYTLVTSITAYDVIEMLCTFMGWVCREQKTDVYFERVDDEDGMIRYIWSDFLANLTDGDIVYNGYENIDELNWMGANHEYTVLQGANMVAVKASVSSDLLSMKLPEFPYGNNSDVEWVTVKYNSGGSWKYFYSVINFSNTAYDNLEYAYFKSNLERTGDHSYTATYLGTSNKTDFINRLTLFPHRGGNWYIAANPLISGAILIKYAIEEETTNKHSFTNGLYCPMLPGITSQDLPIFKMRTAKQYSFNYGYIKLTADMLFNVLSRYNSENQAYLTDSVDDSKAKVSGELIRFVLRVGDKYWNPTNQAWLSQRTSFPVALEGNGIDIEIPVNYFMNGSVELELLAGVTVGLHVNTLHEVIFKTLNVEFYPMDDYVHSSRGTNNYVKNLNTNFRDEVSISTKLASNMNNKPAESIIMEDSQHALSKLAYCLSIDRGIMEYRRPEIDLLNRLEDYYKSVRRRLNLIVKHPEATPLSILRLNGIGDSKIYTPLSESRDWQTEECTLTCFETPETPSES